MRALQIHINGKKICTASVLDDGSIGAAVRSVIRPLPATSRKRPKEDLALEVSGFFASTLEYVRWKTPRLHTGDEILIKILDADRVDKPTTREREDPNLIINEEKKYVENAAKRLGWKIVKPRVAAE